MNKKGLLFLMLVFASYTICHGQWLKGQKSLNLSVGNSEYARSISLTSDGGYILSGNDISSGNMLVIRLDINGDTVWSKRYGGVNEEGWEIKQTLDEGFVAIGHSTTFGIGGATSIYVIRMDGQGDTLWTRVYQGRGRYINITSDSGFIVSGIMSTGASSQDAYLLRLDKNGDTLWNNTYTSTALIGANEGLSVQQTNDGGFILTGTVSIPGKAKDIMLIKTNNNGDTLWTRTIGGNQMESGVEIYQTQDGGYIIAGNTGSFGAGGLDMYLVKTDPNGIVVWAKTYGGTGDDYGTSLDITNDGYIIVGNTESFGANIGTNSIYAVRTNLNGDTLWTKAYGGTQQDQGLSVKHTIDNGFIIAGWERSFGTEINVYLIKADCNGNSGCNEFPTTTEVSNNWSITSIGYTGIKKAAMKQTGTIVSKVSPNTLDLCIMMDSFNANFNVSDTSICINDCIDFSDSSFFLQNCLNNWYYKWYFPGSLNDSSNLQSPTNICYNTPGIYDVTLIIFDTLTSRSDTLIKLAYITVNNINDGDFIKDTTICQGDSVLLSPGNFTSYIWSTGENTPSINADTGSYFVTVTNAAGCITSDTGLISYTNNINLSASIVDTTICLGDSIQLNISGNNNILWTPTNGLSSNTINNPLSSPTQDISYTAKGTDICNQSDSINININVETCSIFFPNIFSPNNDGINDVFNSRGLNIINYNFSIFDKWGNKVFESNNINIGWNGLKHNTKNPVNTGVYIYLLRGNSIDGSEISYKGNVTLVR